MPTAHAARACCDNGQCSRCPGKPRVPCAGKPLQESRDRFQVYLCKERGFTHSGSGSFQLASLLHSRTVRQEPQSDPFTTNTSSCHTLTQTPSPDGFQHTLYKIKILTMSSKSQYNLAQRSLVYLISCPGLLPLFQPTTFLCLPQIYQAHILSRTFFSVPSAKSASLPSPDILRLTPYCAQISAQVLTSSD